MVHSEESFSTEVVIREEGQGLALRMTLGPDGIERFVRDQNGSAIELSLDIAAAMRGHGTGPNVRAEVGGTPLHYAAG